MEIRVLLNMPPFRKNNISFPFAKKFNKPRFFSPFSVTKNFFKKQKPAFCKRLKRQLLLFSVFGLKFDIR